MHDSKIEWVLNPDNKTLGKIWNPITGCRNGCEYCYARRLANTRLKERYLANTNYAPPPKEMVLPNLGFYQQDSFYPRFWPERLKDFDALFAINEPNFLKRLPKKPRGIFVCDMSDLFGIGIPKKWTRSVLEVIEGASYHRFYILTKQAQNLPPWSPFPDNCWVGVSATDTLMMVNALNELYKIEAKIKFLSLEPLLEWNVEAYVMQKNLEAQQLDWVIIGAQTKPTVMPKIEWVREIVEAVDRAGVKVFLKDNLMPLCQYEHAIKYDALWQYDDKSQLRQEMPDG